MLTAKNTNPFVRGYQNLHVVHTLGIHLDATGTDTGSLVWRPVHASQSHLPDGDFPGARCLVARDFAVIEPWRNIGAELAGQGPAGEGIVRVALHAIHGDDFDGRTVHVGSACSAQAAQEAALRLDFKTGFYSRCWEISSGHITTQAWEYLAWLADKDTPPAFLFTAFRIPHSQTIGVKLIATPWTDEVLNMVEGISAEQLHAEHHRKGMPECLIEVLRLAALADVRMLVFDADAPVLDGLPLYDE
jgi:hypothetical protein